MNMHGNIDRCDNGAIEGWLYDADRPEQRLTLQVIAHGMVLGECRADVPRPDLKAAGLADGCISFAFKMPEFLPKAAVDDIRLRIVGSDLFLLPRPAPRPAEAPTVSRFGGMWIDRADWFERLSFKHRTGEIDDDTADQICRFVRDGYIVIPQAVPAEDVAAMNADIERIWHAPPPGLLIETFEPDGKIKYIPPVLGYRPGVTKLLDVFVHSEISRRVTAAPKPTRFLRAIFEEKPKAFQQLSFWRGSQQAIHKDTAYVKIDSNPMRIAATWLALEDVRPGNGELEYYVGSHRAPDFLFGGVSKWMEGFAGEHDRFLSSLHEDAEKYGHKRAAFHGRAGDVLIWHADLAHGGSAITQPDATRRSLVTHLTGAGEEPFYRRNSQYHALETEEMIFVSGFGDVG